MGSKNNACEACAQACFDAKQKVPQLEKRLYVLTIVMTVALTLAGRELIKEVADYLSSINSVVEQSNQLQNTINSDGTSTIPAEKIEQAREATIRFNYCDDCSSYSCRQRVD